MTVTISNGGDASILFERSASEDFEFDKTAKQLGQNHPEDIQGIKVPWETLQWVKRER